MFDAVVCDSVLNSVDSLQAETDVLDCLLSLCKPGGMIFVSGRRSERIASVLRHRKARDPDMRYVEFLDDDGFSAIYRRGLWTFQKFYSFDEAQALGSGNSVRYKPPCTARPPGRSHATPNEKSIRPQPRPHCGGSSIYPGQTATAWDWPAQQ